MSDSLPGLPDRFRLLSTLGRGGMATVYLAEDRAARQQVALKVLFDHLRDDELVRERFRREIAAVRRVRHPNVIAVHDLIENAQLCCMVLEHHPGTDLKRLLRRRGPLPVDELRALALQALDGLAAAHGQGVIHRDIKPHNLLVDEQGTLKITDFGLARVDDLVGLTTHTMTLGTPEYLAPELLGSPLVDGRADLYSLAISLYELLTGRLPFRAASPLELVRLHQEQQLPDPRLQRPELPPALCQAILRAAAKDPDARFATAAEMRAALVDGARPALPAPRPGGHCRHCQAELLPGLSFCLDCGREPVRLSHQARGGQYVYVPVARTFWRLQISRGSDLDQLTFNQKHHLIELLRQLGGEIEMGPEQLDRRLRQLPAVVATRLDPGSAARLQTVLDQAGLPAKIGGLGVWGKLRRALRLARAVHLAPAALIAVILAAVPAGLLGVDPDTVALLVMGLVPLCWGVATYLDGVWRSQPLARFGARAGVAPASQDLSRRVQQVAPRLTSPRLRGLLRRLLARGLDLRAGLRQRDDLPESTLAELDQLLHACLAIAERAASEESALRGLEPAELYEQLQTVDQQLAESSDVEASAALIEAKAQLKQRLGELDERHRELARCYGQLLDAAARLNALTAELHAGDDSAPSVAALSALLGELEAELQARRELAAIAPAAPCSSSPGGSD